MKADIILQGLTMMRPPDSLKVQRRNTARIILLALILLIFFLVSLAFSYAKLWSAWQSSSWGDYWDNFILPLGAGLLGTVSSALGFFNRLQEHIERQEQLVRLLPLRRAAAEGNSKEAPRAEHQPASPAGAAFPFSPTAWEPVYQPLERTAKMMQAFGIVSFTLAGIAGLLLVAFWLSSMLVGTLITGGITALLLGTGALGLLRTRLLRAGISITISEAWLEWKDRRWWGSRRKQIAWHEARAFFTFPGERQPRQPSKQQRVYVLDTDEATFAWVAPEQPDESEREQQERLAGLIAARTSLPLRDLSAAVQALEMESPKASRRTIHPLERSDASQVGGLSPVMKKRLRVATCLTLLPIALLGALSGVAWGLQTYQAHQYENLLAQVHAQAPLFYDHLTSPDDFWYVQKPSASDPRSYQFADHSYQLTGSYGMYDWMNFTYDNAAVEVTASLRGGGKDYQYASVGLVLHTNDRGTDGVVFEISPNGDWTVSTINAYFNGDFSFHHTQAFHPAPGNKNLLTVVMRGSDYLCYVNDHFIGAYHDPHFATGHVGVFSDGATSIAAFNDFIVYPLN